MNRSDKSAALTEPRGTTPLTSRGTRTRELLLTSAQEVFEHDGYLEARVADIADIAGVAHGTFYTYFKSKEEIFYELASSMMGAMLDNANPREEERDDRGLVQRIYDANATYLSEYKAHAKMMGIIEQVATFNADIYAIRQARADAFRTRTARAIHRMQAAGVANRELDAEYAAVALTSMVSRYAYVWLVEGLDLGSEIEMERSVQTLTDLWVSALGLDAQA